MSGFSQSVVTLVNLLVSINALLLMRRLREAQEQAWFWTPNWLAGEAEAEADIANGRVERFLDHEDFVKSLMGAQPGRPEGPQASHAFAS